jgi:transcription elongation factor GreA
MPEGITIMTATISAASRHEVLAARLAVLRSERDQTLSETIPTGAGDMADRATNVDGHVRLAMLERRIATVESELAASHQTSPHTANGHLSVGDISVGDISVGDVVTLDLGEGSETFLLGSVDEAGDTFDVITPSSPLGQALQGARLGSTVAYSIGIRTLHATVTAISR